MFNSRHAVYSRFSLSILLGLGLFLTACAPESTDSSHEQAQTAASTQNSTAPVESAHSAAPVSESGARVALLEGDATLSDAQGSRPLAKEMLVTPGQTLRTGSKTHVELLFADGSRLRVSPAAEVKFGHQSQDADALFQVAKGEVWGNIRPAKRKLVLQGRHSTAAVLGTVYTIKVTDKDTCTRVIEGNVGVHRPQTGSEAEMIAQAPAGIVDEKSAGLQGMKEGDLVVPQDQWMKLATHQCIVVGAEGKAHVMKIDPEKLAKEEAWVKWNLERDKQLPPHQ